VHVFIVMLGRHCLLYGCATWRLVQDGNIFEKICFPENIFFLTIKVVNFLCQLWFNRYNCIYWLLSLLGSYHLHNGRKQSFAELPFCHES